jgi:PST family polysaccharide transporter
MFKKIANYSLNSNFLLNLFSVGFTSVLSRLLGLITVGYPARILGPEKYGYFSLALTITAFASILLLPGMTLWGSRNIALDKSSLSETLVTVNSTRFVLACFAYILLFIYAFFNVENSVAQIVILLYGLNLFSQSLLSDWVFNGIELARIPSYINLFVSVLNVFGIILLIKSPNDVVLYSLFTPTFTLISSIILFYILIKRGVNINFPSISSYIISWKSSFILGLSNSLVILLHYANNFIVDHFLGAKALGLFTAAFFLFELISMIPMILNTIFYSTLARTVNESRFLAVKYLRSYALVNIIIGFFIASIIFAESDSIISMLYGPEYQSSSMLLKYMSIGIIFNFAISGYTNPLVSFGADKIILYVVAISCIISILGGIIMIPIFGVVGASIVISIVDFAGWLVSLPYFLKNIGSLGLARWKWSFLGSIAIIVFSFLAKDLMIPFFLRLTSMTFLYLIFIKNQIVTVLRGNFIKS